MNKNNHREPWETGYIECLKLLTRREIEVLELIGQGYTYKEATEALIVSVHTIHSHVKAIKKKLGVAGYRGLGAWYRENWEE